MKQVIETGDIFLIGAKQWKISANQWKAAKKILALGEPIHMLVDSKAITHTFCNRQALIILYNDGLDKAAELVRKYLHYVNQGSCWADRGWKCLAHYLHPDNGRGLGPWPDAAQEGKSYFEIALNLWKQGKMSRSFFYLGASLHLLQDVCVPHHAKRIAFNGHQSFEKWARKNRHNYQIKANGLYKSSKTKPEEWFYDNAGIAVKYYHPSLCSKSNEDILHHTVGILLPLAQKTAAGFINYFFQNLNYKN